MHKYIQMYFDSSRHSLLHITVIYIDSFIVEQNC